MGGWISLIICVVPIYLFYVSNHIVLMIFSIVNAAINFWSFGVMHNYAMQRSIFQAEQVRKNRELEEEPLSLEDEVRLHKIENILRASNIMNVIASEAKQSRSFVSNRLPRRPENRDSSQ